MTREEHTNRGGRKVATGYEECRSDTGWKAATARDDWAIRAEGSLKQLGRHSFIVEATSPRNRYQPRMGKYIPWMYKPTAGRA
jgi:hypothetical protein